MQPYHIIIAEDEPDIRIILHSLLTRHIYPGVQCTLVGDGQAALLAFQQTGADLVITDYNMPVMHGLELVKKLREQHATVPIILHSIWDLDKQARAAGVTHFMNYPLDLEELKKVIHELLPPQIS